MANTFENINKVNQIISDNIDDPIFIINRNLKCEYINFGELKIEKHLIDYLHPEDSKKAPKFVESVLTLGSGTEELRIRDKNNEFKWYEIKGKSFVGDDNEKRLLIICRDITKFKNIEKEIKESQRRYTKLADTLPEIKYWKLLQSRQGITAVEKAREMLEVVINNIPQYIYWKDLNLTYLGCNSNFADLNGLEHPNAIIGMNDNELRWIKDKFNYILESERKVMKDDKPEYKVIELLTTGTRSQAWFEINRIPLHDLKGNVVGILVTYQDITIRKTTEHRLKESEEKYHTIFNASPDYIFLLDINGNILEMNPALLNRMGLSLDKVRGLNFSKFYAGENIADMEQFADNLIKGNGVKGLEVKAKSNDGEIFEYEVNSVPLMEDGKVVKFLNLARDITLRKKTEQKLKESEKRYRHLFNTSPYAIWVMDEDGAIIDCNSTVDNLLSALKREDLIGKKFFEVLSVLERPNYLIDILKNRFNKFLQGEKLGTLEFQITRIDGKKLWLAILSSLVKVGDRTLTQAIIQDITEKKNSEQKLKDSEIKYRHLFEKSPYSIILIDRKGNIIDCNPTTERIFNRRVDDLIGKNFLKINIKPETAIPLFKDRYQNILKGLVPEPMEIEVKRSIIGDPIWINIDESLVEISGETVFQVIIQDITEKKIAEQELKKSQEELQILNRELEQKVTERTKDLIESEQQYKVTIDSLADPLHVVDKNLKIILANRELNKWLNQLDIHANVIGQKVSDLFPFLPAVIYEEYEQVFDKGIPLITQETTQLPSLDVITETRKIPIFSEGKVVQVITIIRDITERKEMEDQLKESEEKYRNMVNNLDVAFYQGKYKGKLLMHNQALNRIIGLKPDESIIGAQANQFFIDETMMEKYYRRLEEKGYIRNFITQIKKKNGDIITVDLNAHLIYDSQGNPIEIEGTFTDITEKFKLQQDLLVSEKKLREQNIELMKLDQIKNDFITMAAHELKTPLISISGYTDYILMKHRNSLSPEITEDLTTVQRNVKRLEILMDQLLEVMKIDEDKLKLQKEEINISIVINDCLDELSYLINEKNIELILDIDYEIMLNVDPERIFTVFTNLISNAIKFTPDYGWIEISAKREDNKYLFQVKDNGIGMNKGDLTKIFKKFERIKPHNLSEDVNIKDSGTGLGLYITKGLVNAHGGTIWANSDGVNEGSTFSFTLPI
ncbi:MAG: PAS domain S-box protein [Candidatus Thorarchaeota archaeon]